MPVFRVLLCAAGAIAALQALSAWAQDAPATHTAARVARNPFAEVITLPILYDASFGGGLGSKTQQALSFEPVVPFEVNADWDVITRTIVPLIAQPALAGAGASRGLGDIQFSAFVSPDKVGRLDWGVGPVFQLPSATNSVLGQGKWGAGPTAAVIWLGEQWMLGGVVNNIWSFAGDRDRPAVNQMQLQPLVTWYFPEAPARYLSFSPVVTANWKAQGRERWTVPLSLGIGEAVKFDRRPVTFQATASYNLRRPSDAAAWTLELGVQFQFPN